MTKQDLLSKIDKTYRNHDTNTDPILSEYTILTLHRLCSVGGKEGCYRTTAISPLGVGHKPPAPDEIHHFMEHFINQMKTSRIMFHPVEFAAIAYKRLLDICPFKTNNEETAAMFLNLLLAREGYPIVNQPSDLPGYEEVMKQARTMPFPDTDPLVILIATAVLDISERTTTELS